MFNIHPLSLALIYSKLPVKHLEENKHCIPNVYCFDFNKGFYFLIFCKLCKLKKKEEPIYWKFLDKNYKIKKIINIQNVDTMMYGDLCEECMKF